MQLTYGLFEVLPLSTFCYSLWCLYWQLEEQTQAERAFLLLVVPDTQELFCQVGLLVPLMLLHTSTALWTPFAISCKINLSCNSLRKFIDMSKPKTSQGIQCVITMLEPYLGIKCTPISQMHKQGSVQNQP